MLKLFSLAPFGSATSESLKERPRSQRANKPPSQLTGGVTLEMRAKFRRRERVWSLLSVLFCLNQPPYTFLLSGPLCTGKGLFQFWVSKGPVWNNSGLWNANSLRPNCPFNWKIWMNIFFSCTHAFVVICACNIAQEIQLCLGCKALPRLLWVLWMYFATNSSRTMQSVHFW